MTDMEETAQPTQQMTRRVVGVRFRVAGMIYEMIRGLAAAGKAVLLVDQNIKRALEIADYVYVMRTGTVLSEGSRDAFGGDTEALVARWLYASGNAEQA